MKIRLILVLIIIVAIISFSMGCSPKMGYIMRNDITYKDLEFFYEGTEGNMDATIDDMYCVLGLPHAIGTNSPLHYYYYFEDEIFKKGVIDFIFYSNGKIIGAPISSYPDVYDIEPFDIGPVIIDRKKNKMELRDNIIEEELSIIDEKATSVEVQKMLGAPHGHILSHNVGLRTDAYTYPLTSGNTLRIAYERSGIIVKAWVVDEEGNELKVLVDRTDVFGTWDDI